MALDESFLEALSKCIGKVRSDIEAATGAVTLGAIREGFDAGKFKSTLFKDSLGVAVSPKLEHKALAINEPLKRALQEKLLSFFKAIGSDGLLPSHGQLEEDFLKGLDAKGIKAFRELKIVSNLLVKFSVSFLEYAIKEERWDEIGYLGPRGARVEPPKVIIENNIAMTEAVCPPAFQKTNPPHRFFNPEYEELMDKKNALLRDNIKDIDEYPQGYEADIVIIGTGPGGAAAAYALSKEAKGKNIVVLERGDLYTSDDFNQKERDMVPALYQWPGFRLTDELGVAVLQGNLVGGTAVLNHGICYEVPRHVTVDWKEADGTDETDIATQLEVGGCYDKVKEMINYHQIEKFALNKNAQVLLRGLKEIKEDDELEDLFEYHSRNTNAKIKPGDKAGHMHDLSCTGCGFCPLACRYDRKQTPLITFIPAALENGLNGVGGNEVRVYKRAEVDKILHEDGKVRGVSIKGSGLEIKAKTVIVSCGAINSARLLMRSGVENEHLGKHISLHPSPLVFARFEDEKIYADWGVPMAASYNEYQFPKPDEIFKDGFGYILETIYSHPATTALTMPLATLRERMKDYENMASVAIILHDKPVGEIKKLDPLFTCISYKMDNGDKIKLRHAIRTAAEIYLKAGATEVFTSHEKELVFRNEADLAKADNCSFEPGDILLASAHPQGGCRMGSPGKGVVDYNGHSHDIKGLFVSDASLYPTSLGVNPQLTTMAMGTKIGEYVAGRD